MADFFFFTDTDLINNNGTYQVDGSESPYPATAGRSVPYSVHEVKKNPDNNPNASFSELIKTAGVYAICSGKVLINNGANAKCSLILKPDVQPANLPKIKYIIYGGVLTRSLVYPSSAANIQPPYIMDGVTPKLNPYFNNLSLNIYTTTGNVLSAFTPNGTTGRPSAILDAFKKFDDPTGDAFLEYLFEEGNDLFQSFTVRGGDRLGCFSDHPSLFFSGPINFPESVSVMIVFDTPNINLTFKQLTDIAEFEIYKDDAPLSVKTKMKRDLLNNFLDPAAFYGNILTSERDVLRCRKYADAYTTQTYTVNGVNVVLPDVPVTTPVTLQDGYTTIMSKFANRNKVYIDIRDNEGNGYNFADELETTAGNKDMLVAYNTETGYEEIDYDESSPCLTLQHRKGNAILINDHTSPSYIAPLPANLQSKLYIKFRTSKSLPYNLKPSFANSGLQISPAKVKLHNDIVNSFSSESPCAPPVPEKKNASAGKIYSASSFVSKGKANSNFFEISDEVITNSLNEQAFALNKTPFVITIPLVTDVDVKLPIANYMRIVHVKSTQPKPNFKLSCVCDPGDPFAANTKSVEDIIDFPISRAYLNFGHLDNFFLPFKMRPPVDNKRNLGHFDVTQNFQKVSANVYFDEYYCDNTVRGANNAYMAYPGIAVDKGDENVGDVTLFAFACDNITSDASKIDNNFKIAGAFGTSHYFLDQAIQSNGGAATGLIFNRNKLLAADVEMPQDIMVSYISKNASIPVKSGFLATVALSSFAYIAIDKITWKNLLVKNYGMLVSAGDSFTFIAPERTRLTFKLKKKARIPAYDELGEIMRDLVEIEKFEIYLVGEVVKFTGPDPQTVTRSFATGLYAFYATSLPVETNIEPPPPLPSAEVTGKGYRTENNAGVTQIKTTVFLVPLIGVTDAEMYYYKQYFECNIKQIWTNVETIIPYNRGLHEDSSNLLPSSSNKISAQCIQVLAGTNSNLSNLGDGQIAFLVAPAINPAARSFVDFTKRRGVMYFDRSLMPPNGVTRYFSANPANVPAHEFGHCLLLNDRYTYVAKYNSTTKNIINNTVNGISSYMENNGGVTVDARYSELYNWIFNLYSTQAYTKLSLAITNDFDLIRDQKFIQLYGKGTPNVITQDFHKESNTVANCTPFSPPTSEYTSTFINAGQFLRVLQNAEDEESYYLASPEFHIKYFFFMRYFMFFNKSSNAKGTFVGLKHSGSSFQIMDDFGFSPEISNLQADRMDNRITNLGNINGFYSPLFKPFLDENGDLVKETVIDTSQPNYKQDLLYGGLNTIKGLIDAFSNDKLLAELNNLQANTTAFNLRIINISNAYNIYQNRGYGNAVGAAIWNKVLPPVRSTTYNTYKILYSEFSNRLTIINTIAP